MLFSWFLQLARYYIALGMYIICLQVFYKALAYFRNNVHDLITAFYLQKKLNVKNGSLVQSNNNTKKTYMHHRRLFFVKELYLCTTISETTLFISAMTVKNLIFGHWTVDYSRPHLMMLSVSLKFKLQILSQNYTQSMTVNACV